MATPCFAPGQIFKTVEDLALVKGIGERTIEINRANILLKASNKK